MEKMGNTYKILARKQAKKKQTTWKLLGRDEETIIRGCRLYSLLFKMGLYNGFLQKHSNSSLGSIGSWEFPE
jgi:hypothetical protein